MTNCILMSISSFLILVCQFLEKIMSEENNNQSLPADKSEKSPVIIIEGKSSGSSHKICKSIGKVLLTIGSIITFARNLVFNLIFLLLILAIFSGIYFANNAKGIVENTAVNADGSVKTVSPILYFDLSGTIHEMPQPDNEYTKFTKQFSDVLNTPEYNDVVSIEEALNTASDDKRIKSVYFNFSKTDRMPMPVASRVKKAILDYKKKNPGVMVNAYSDAYNTSSYLIATACDKIILDPLGGFTFRGFSASSLYFKDLLNRFNLSPLVFRAGEFKSAVEPFTSNRMSEPVKEEYRKAFNILWLTYLKSLNSRPNTGSSIGNLYAVPDNYIKTLVNYQGSEAELLNKLNLVDELMSQEDFNASLIKLYGQGKSIFEPKLTGYQDYLTLASLSNHESPKKSDKKLSSVAVIYGIGDIVDKTESPATFSPDNIKEVLDDIRKDKSVNNVLLYINSGGGSVTASEKIRNMLLNFKKETGKTLTVSMNGLAASGAYWISTAADYVYASPETITGSIGVFSLGISADKLLNEYGVYEDGVETSELARTSIAREMPQSQKIEIQLSVESIYKRFITIVRNAHPELQKVDYREFAEGRIFTVYDAKKLHLINDIDTFDNLIANAKKQIEKDKNTICKVKHFVPDGIDSQFILKRLLSTHIQWLVSDNTLKMLLSWFDTASVKGSNTQKTKIMATSAFTSIDL